MRGVAEQQRVLGRGRLALHPVGDDDGSTAALGHGPHLAAGGEAGASVAQETGRLDEVEQAVVGAAGLSVSRQWSMPREVRGQRHRPGRGVDAGQESVGDGHRWPMRAVGRSSRSTKIRTNTAANTATVLTAAMARLQGASASVPELM